LSTPPPTFDTWFRERHAEIRLEGARAVLALAREGATVAFIARYRKERTGNLDEVAVQKVIDAGVLWERILNRQTIIRESIERHGKLTPELREKIEAAFDLDELEDLYLPYRQKRKTRAALAREAGLEPLADWIWGCGHGTETPQPGQTLELWAFTFRNPEKAVPEAEAAVAGARDILVERMAERQELRALVRRQVLAKGHLRSVKTDKAKPHSKYENYFDYTEAIAALRQARNTHRYLAARRGAAEEEIRLSVGGPPGDPGFEERLLAAYEQAACTVPDSPGAAVLREAARLALREHVLPAIEGEVHRLLKEAADEAAIAIFADNVRRLLLEPPFGPRPVLAIDPGIRTGSKLAVVDGTGAFLRSDVIDIRSEEGKARGRERLAELAAEAKVEAVAVGNGTGGREAERFARAALREKGSEVPVVLVSEAGASVYSVSEAAREELPGLDATVRGAISIARRLQDPLAELVKIEPRSIGVGQYQHDVAGRALEGSLERVVDSCVNRVGVELNTASVHLLTHVSGIGPALARAIVEHREKAGLFPSRAALREVPRFGPRAFEQAAGFLRVRGGHPLDATGVHPERYPALERLAARRDKRVEDLLGPGVPIVREAEDLRAEVGPYTFEDILRELEQPGRDPRPPFVPFAFREDVHAIADLAPGMVCPGVVTNVTHFGAFVDVGVHQDGLVHLSQLGDSFVKDPRDVVKPGDRVQVRVLQVNLEKKQISLSMRAAAPAAPAPRARRAKARPERRDGGRPPRPPASRPKPGVAKREPRPPQPAPKPAPAKGPEARPRPPSPSRERPQPARGPARPAFNNPFAVLADLKLPTKKPR
jgi:uncharacterized protein